MSGRYKISSNEYPRRIKSKNTLDEANVMQVAYADTKNKNAWVDGIRRAFICNVRQLNWLI